MRPKFDAFKFIISYFVQRGVLGRFFYELLHRSLHALPKEAIPVPPYPNIIERVDCSAVVMRSGNRLKFDSQLDQHWFSDGFKS
jgi:hypothetical protein